ncbi:hypothetical protein CDA63_15365 [Hymenobacter amundsenii]|uniref:SMI1/KNR4 family protein n=2 Tax=Hymenobacter amundsenii TaxID=2006685 RepID=A0A246FI39_9BACT|nr:hypothetical protein CDA63_15365 [Hymenobacter amundsenii]
MNIPIMDAESMRQSLAVAAINVRQHFEPLRNENIELLHRVGLSEEALQFFEEFSFDRDLEVGELHYDQANCFKKNLDWEDAFQRALRTELLLVGSGPSGDPIAVDLHDYQVGYLFHDYFWDEENEEPRKFFIKMNCSLGQLFMNAITIEGYPIDAYEAAAYTGSEFTGYWSPENTD